MKKVLFAAFESLPFIKTGGLADVIYALPKALDKNEFEVRVVMPLFQKVKDKYGEGMNYVDTIEVHSGYLNTSADVYSYFNEGIEYLFIDHGFYFGRKEVYGYDDDVSRFCFFNVAVMEMMIKLNYYPDIIHTHDYHTAVIPALCKIRYNAIEEIARIKHMFTIHNLVYQGIYDKQVLFDLLAFDYRYYEDGSLRYGDGCNFMKIAFTYADVITTVSETYAEEVKTAELGEGLDPMLKYREGDLYGIVNGIDISLFDPMSDNIACHYNIDNYKEGKAVNKLALQRELGLDENPDAMVVGMVSRLTFQKGADLIVRNLENMLSKNVQVVILGTGEERFENTFAEMEYYNKGRAVFYKGYNEGLAHRIYAGIDMLLMPSLFEPCGISQLISMRYGTLPLVRETGGLKDTVEPYNCFDKTGRGFSFGPYSVTDMENVFNYAYETFTQYHDDWDMMIRNGMTYDVSFDSSARKYEDIYRLMLNK